KPYEFYKTNDLTVYEGISILPAVGVGSGAIEDEGHPHHGIESQPAPAAGHRAGNLRIHLRAAPGARVRQRFRVSHPDQPGPLADAAPGRAAGATSRRATGARAAADGAGRARRGAAGP